MNRIGTGLVHALDITSSEGGEQNPLIIIVPIAEAIQWASALFIRHDSAHFLKYM